MNPLLKNLLMRIPVMRAIIETRETQTPVTLPMWFLQKVVGFNRHAYWPVHFTSKVGNVANIYAGIDTAPGWSPGCYIQGGGKTVIGDYTQIGPNVGIISSNHDHYDSRHHIPGEVSIGKYCWIGMGAVLLPGTVLGDFTVVGAGTIVTKQFPDGYCVLAGNPARLVKLLDRDKCVPFRNSHEYHGYIPARQFEEFRKRNLRV